MSIQKTDESATGTRDLTPDLQSLVGTLQRDLQSLELGERQTVDGMRQLSAHAASLVQLGREAHAYLAEQTMRFQALVREAGRQNPLDPELIEVMHDRLRSLGRISPRRLRYRARFAPRRKVLKPGLVGEHQLVLYRLGNMHFVVRGRMRFNIHHADPMRHYRERHGSSVLPVFPEPGHLWFPDTPVHMMVVEPVHSTSDDTGRGISSSILGLFYDEIEDIIEFHPRLAQRVHPLKRSHRLIRGSFRRRRCNYLVVSL